MNLPEEIYNNIIINYSNIYDNYLINKHIENQRKNTINNAIKTINKYIYKYILELRIAMDINYYQIPKIIWKKFYPLNRRKYVLSIMIKHIFKRATEYQKCLYYKILCNPKCLVENFNKFIDSIELNDLFQIEW